MKKLLLLSSLCFFTFSSFGQHDVFFNFSDFLDESYTFGYRYHLTEYTSLGGDISFSDKLDGVSTTSRLKANREFRISSEYLVYFNPKQGCDKFYVGPNLAFKNLELDYEEEDFYSGNSEIIKYTNTARHLILSLSIGGTWRHKSGFFFNANGTLGRSIYASGSTTLSNSSYTPSKKQVIFRPSLIVGWQFGKKKGEETKKVNG